MQQIFGTEIKAFRQGLSQRPVHLSAEYSLDGQNKKFNRCDILKLVVEKVLVHTYDHSSLYLNPVTPSRCTRIVLHLKGRVNPAIISKPEFCIFFTF